MFLNIQYSGSPDQVLLSLEFICLIFIADFELFADIFIPVFSSLFPKQCQ